MLPQAEHGFSLCAIFASHSAGFGKRPDFPAPSSLRSRWASGPPLPSSRLLKVSSFDHCHFAIPSASFFWAPSRQWPKTKRYRRRGCHLRASRAGFLLDGSLLHYFLGVLRSPADQPTGTALAGRADAGRPQRITCSPTMLSPEFAVGIRLVKGIKQLGSCTGYSLTCDQASLLLERADGEDLRGLRDLAMIAILLGCGLRRAELSARAVCGRVREACNPPLPHRKSGSPLPISAYSLKESRLGFALRALERPAISCLSFSHR